MAPAQHSSDTWPQGGHQAQPGEQDPQPGFAYVLLTVLAGK